MSDWTPEITPEIAEELGGSAMTDDDREARKLRIAKRAASLVMTRVNDPKYYITLKEVMQALQQATQEDEVEYGRYE